MKKTVSLLLALFAAIGISAQNWGDQGDDTYINPVLNADYSDPDVIRVGDVYYMVASDFHFVGMQILKSYDLVNWTIVTQIFDRFDLPGWDSNSHYGGGSWAPSLRYHDGKFWVYFCTPDEGLFMTTAKKAEGPWEPLYHVKDVKKWEDPCPVWDDEGNAYLGRSAHGAGPIILHRMSPDGRTLLDDGDTIYQGPVAEGTKFYHYDDWWYLIIPEGGVGTGWQTALRSHNLYGPYERKVVLEQGTTDINGPHQGALVEDPAYDWWFYHFQETSPMGRVVHLQPVHWENGWPLIGMDFDGNGIGEPVYRNQMPFLKSSAKRPKPHVPQTSDSFRKKTLSPQWQFCHNPHDAFWSLKEKRGWLTIHAEKSQNLMMAHNMLTQKCMGWSGQASTVFDATDMADGQRAGLLCMGQSYYGFGLMKENGQLYVYSDAMFRAQKIEEYAGTQICVAIKYDAVANSFQFLYGPTSDNLKPFGQPFSQRNGNWKGCRFGLYTYNTESDAGLVRFDRFDYPIVHSGFPENDGLLSKDFHVWTGDAPAVVTIPAVSIPCDAFYYNYIMPGREFGVSVSTSREMSAVQDNEYTSRSWEQDRRDLRHYRFYDEITVPGLEDNTTYYYRAFVGNDDGTKVYGEVKSFRTAFVNDTKSDVKEYVDLGLSVNWATCNIGASTPEEFGDFFAWGVNEPNYYSQNPLTWKENCHGGYILENYYDYSHYTTNKDRTVVALRPRSTLEDYKYVDGEYRYYSLYGGLTQLIPDDDVAHVKWGGNWRMPTLKECKELVENCTWTVSMSKNSDKVEGWTATSKINGNSIFLPAVAGYYDTSLDEGSKGRYWSSSLSEGYSYSACALSLNRIYDYRVGDYDDMRISVIAREYGLPVRPVCTK